MEEKTLFTFAKPRALAKKEDTRLRASPHSWSVLHCGPRVCTTAPRDRPVPASTPKPAGRRAGVTRQQSAGVLPRWGVVAGARMTLCKSQLVGKRQVGCAGGLVALLAWSLKPQLWEVQRWPKITACWTGRQLESSR